MQKKKRELKYYDKVKEILTYNDLKRNIINQKEQKAPFRNFK